MSEQKPWDMDWSKQSQNHPNNSNVMPWEMNYGTQEPQKQEEKGFLGQAQDAGVSLLKGVVAVPETIVGLADIPTGGQVGKFIEENTPIQFKQTKDIINDWHTDQYKEQQRQFSEAGQNEDTLAGKVIEKGKVALSNPSMIFNTVVESAPSMLAGGAVGRGLGLASKVIKPIAAGAIGEGAVMAGQQAENIRYETEDKLLTPEQSGIALATGAVGSLFGLAGGQVAKKLGFDDLETAMASGRFNSQLVGESIQKMPLSSIPKSIIGGALTEGLVEELPQSVSEQLLQNYALGKPLDEGVDSAIVMGALAGMAMGGGMNTVSAPMNYLQNNKAYKEQLNKNTQPEQPPSDSQIQYDNGLDFTQPEITPTEQQTIEQNPTSYDNQVNFESPAPVSDSWTLGESQPEPDVEQGNTINYEHPALNTEIQIATVPDYVFPAQEQTPSQKMGINPEDGPMSTAAALALDSGAAQIVNAPTEQNANSTTLTDAATLNATDVQSTLPSEYENKTAQDIQHGMNEIAKGAQAAAFENTIQRLEKDGEVQLFKEDSIAKAFENQDYNVRLNDDGSASIIGVRNPETNQWHGQGKEDTSQVSTSIETSVNHQNSQPLERLTQAERVSRINHRIDDTELNFGNKSDVVEKEQLRQEINDLKFERQTLLEQQEVLPDATGIKTSDLTTALTVPNTERIEPTAKADAQEVSTSSTQDTSILTTNDSKGLLEQQIQQTTRQIESEVNVPKRQQLSKQLAILNQEYEKLSQREQGVKLTTDLNTENSNLNHQNNNIAAQIAQLEQQLSDAKTVSQKVKPRKQIAELHKDNPVYQAAHAAATSIQNDLPEPTQAQIEAGNYKKGHIKVHGLDIAVENPRGSERRGTDPDGNEWSHTMSDHYGYIKRTTGADQENIDTYVGKNHDSDKVFVVDQIDQGTNGFDEHKVMLGFDNQEEAITAYQSNFDKGWKVGAVNEMTRDQFKEWLKNSDTTKPAATKNLKDSIENIRAEKIRQKNINDLHDGVYGNASMQELENSLNLLSKKIQKNHELSIGEMSSGKRSTRKAVASGAVDNFRKQKMDLEAYIKARKSGEVKQKKLDQNDKKEGNDINDFSRDRLDSDEKRKGISPIETTFNPLSITGATRRVLSVLQHLKLPTTQDTSVRGRINIGRNSLKSSFSVQVVSSFDGLPSEIQNDATYQDENGKTQNYDVSGVWHDGTLYVVADQVYGDSTKQLTTFDAYEELLAHEIIGHFGVQQIFGSEYKSKLQQLFNALGGLDGIRKIAKKNGVDMPQFESSYIQPYTQGAKDKIYSESDVQQALVGELFAFIAQNQSKQPFVRQKIKEVIGFIRQWFRERGFDKFLSRYNDTDLMMFIAEARKAVVDQSYFGKYKNQKISSKDYLDTPLYSRRSESKKSSTIQLVRDVLVARFGEDVVSELERQGKLEIIQDYDVEGVEGFYYNGKAVLVASNLTKESAVPTFLHELGGHGGFQNMMSEKQYQELMRQFDKLVEQGNPIAMAAKLLAEREQGTTRQKLEYLPYLLTFSSTMQQRNVIQRNALQKLINNIVAYVKAWAFDRLGINLNLNPDDILALSERMVKQIKHQSSLDLIRQKYQGTSQWMTAPNGANTHLSEQQWLQVRTPEFKKWFGDWENDTKNSSQVLDENGEPKVVYHGTATEFNEFKQGHGLLGDGIYLTDSFDTADMYANIRGNNGFVLPLFVNIRSAFKTSGNVSRDKIVDATRSGKYQGVVHQFDNQEYIVALESNQVKMAEGNKGTFNSESADIRFSRSSNSAIDRLSQNIRDLSVKSIKDKTGYRFKDWLGIGLSALGRRQLTEIYSKLLPQLNKYNDLAAQMDADKNDAGAEADGIVREWAKLKDESQLADLMHDATLAKIDPDKPYVSGDSVSRYKQLRSEFRSLSPEAQQMYRDARDAYKNHYAKVQFAIKERILRAALSSQKKADLIKQMDDQFYGYVKGVYFPLSRFGKYVVVSRNAKGEVESVSRAETMGGAQKIRSEMIQKFPQWKIDPVIRDQQYKASRDAVGRGFMTNLFDEVANLGLSPSETVDFEDTLNQLYLSSMPDLSWAKHGIHRKGTAGFSQDARRAFAQNMFSGAGYLAKLRYGDQMAEQLDEMKKHSKEQIKINHSYNQSAAAAVIDEMESRHELLMNPKSHPLSSALTSLGFIYYLGLSPAAAMVNLSQTALVAYPIMGAKWGFDKAGKELLRASNDFRKGVEFHKPEWNGIKTDWYKTMSADISKFLNRDEQQAYKSAVDQGVIDVTQAHDLAGIAQGEDSGVMWKTRPIMRAASTMFHNAERFNREVTFIAAYRLARQSGTNHGTAYTQAVDATYKGHFDYSSGNRPRVMQGNVAKVLLLFKQFGQNMIYTLVRQTYQSFKAETTAERIEARKSLGAILGMHAMFAGVLGLPLVGMLLSAASALGGDDDEPWDAEIALRNYLAEAFGPTVSNLLMKGAPRALSPVDMSGRVGINNLIFPDVQEGIEGKRWAESAMSATLGPVAGIGMNVAKGIQEISEGHHLRGIESMLPVFLKNFAKTYRYSEEGVQDKTGVSIKEEVGSADLFVQGIGFSPSDVRTANEGKTAIYQQDRKLNERRSRLMTLWSRAKMLDDQNEMDEIWKEVQGFNEKNPSRRISKINLMQSYKNRQRRIDKAEDGIYLSKKREGARDAGYFAFGE